MWRRSPTNRASISDICVDYSIFSCRGSRDLFCQAIEYPLLENMTGSTEHILRTNDIDQEAVPLSG